MTKSQDRRTNKLPSTAGELLKLYDNLSAHNACAAFITQALASTLVTGGLDTGSNRLGAEYSSGENIRHTAGKWLGALE